MNIMNTGKSCYFATLAGGIIVEFTSKNARDIYVMLNNDALAVERIFTSDGYIAKETDVGWRMERNPT
jgi:hypothetical protein